MPRVKIDYVVSFSSEDPENPAANLLSWEAGRGRWLCAGGEPAASVVLQLARACTISSVTIGAHQAALVEVLVGRSETPSEPYQVLVPSSVFLGPRESRGAGAGGAGAERVRTFALAALSAAACAQRWDRVRVVATQPYNKHCKYGISFVHMFEPEQAPAPAAPVPPPALALPSQEEEEEEAFRPGELFALHRRAAAAAAPATSDTGAQIRQATSQALRSDPDAATSLKKAHIPRGRASTGGGPAAPAAGGPRDKDALLYAAEERRAHRRSDHILEQHDADKRKNDTETSTLKPGTSKVDKTNRSDDDSGHVTARNSDGLGTSRRDESRKRPHSNQQSKKESTRTGNRSSTGLTTSSPPNKPAFAKADGGGGARPLEGVVFVLSGYENPRRARLRALAESLGARPRRDWGPACTHLICAFPNTPKMRAVQAAGARVPVVRAEWLEACARARRLVPWRAHATDPAALSPPPSSPAPSPPHRPPEECDTDDEIEEVLRQQKRRRTVCSPSPPCAGGPGALGEGPADEDDVQLVKDERMQGNVTVESDSCDTEPEPEAGAGAGGGAELPALLEGLAFLVAEPSAAPLDARLLARYARAYGGHLLTAEEAESFDAPYYVLCGARGAARAGGGSRLRADWLWACHEARARLPTADYLLSPSPSTSPSPT